MRRSRRIPILARSSSERLQRAIEPFNGIATSIFVLRHSAHFRRRARSRRCRIVSSAPRRARRRRGPPPHAERGGRSPALSRRGRSRLRSVGGGAPRGDGRLSRLGVGEALLQRHGRTTPSRSSSSSSWRWRRRGRSSSFAEIALRRVANAGRGTPGAWWVTILIIGPILGSFITEPAAMTICALLLARQFYDLQPARDLKYATLGLLFVNVSIGGTLTHFAAPPVLMVARHVGLDHVVHARALRLARGARDRGLDAGLLPRSSAPSSASLAARPTHPDIDEPEDTQRPLAPARAVRG